MSALRASRANKLSKSVSDASRHYTKRTRRPWKSTTVATYIGAFLFIITIVAIGYQPPQPNPTDSVANAVTPQTLASASNEASSAPSVDQLIATRVAAGIAERAELPIARNVANLSLSLSVESELAQADNNAIVKPQIIEVAANSREIRKYTTVTGDTVDKVAAQFNVTAETIKWANNLTSNLLEPGTKLQILPTNGIIYTVESGDTVASIAKKYGANITRITLQNDLLDESVRLKVGQKLIIPDGELPTTERPGYVAPQPTYQMSAPSDRDGSIIGSFRGGSVGNRYAYGNCTYYAYDRRAAIGRPIGSFWGNAATWAAAARASGYTVNNTPAPGAVAQWNAYSDPWIGYYGHVGIVESVNSDGTVTITEMNNGAYGGFNIVNRRTIPANSVSNYIH